MKFKEKGYQVKDYHDKFPNLSSIRFITLMNMIHYHTSGMDNPQLIVDIQDFFVEAIKLLAKEDLFALTKNIRLDYKELNQILKSRPLNKTTLAESKEIGKILVSLVSLTHGIYNDWCTDYDYEISGPYNNKDKMILIRSFPDTKPTDIWPEIDWFVENVSIITQYKDLKAKIAFVGCHIIYDGNAVEKLDSYNLQVNGKEVKGLTKLKKLRDKLMPIAAAQYEKFLTMDFENQKIKFVTQEHYQLNQLFTLVGMDWRPSKDVLNRIKNKNLKPDIFKNYQMTIDDYQEVFGANKMIEAYKRLFG